MENFKTIEKNCETILVEKKSKFIANSFYVESEAEAEDIIKKIKKQYYDARHNCWAYRVIKKGENGKINIISKGSDDGEPSGTAGAPMLNILDKNEFTNVLVIVTRYFGGILLGTGGLVKAYSESTLNVINESKLKEISRGYEIKVRLEYKDVENFKYYCRKNDIKIVKEEYMQDVELNLELKESKYNILNDIVKDEYKNKKLNVKELKIIEEKYI